MVNSTVSNSHDDFGIPKINLARADCKTPRDLCRFYIAGEYSNVRLGGQDGVSGNDVYAWFVQTV